MGRGGGGAGGGGGSARGRAPDGRKLHQSGGLFFARRRGGATSVDRDYAVVEVSVSKLDKDWRTSGNAYIDKSGKGAITEGGKDRRTGFREFLQDGGGSRDKPIEMSRVRLDQNGRPQFADGRHRFAVMRDDGKRKVPVLVPRSQEAAFRKRFG